MRISDWSADYPSSLPQPQSTGDHPAQYLSRAAAQRKGGVDLHDVTKRPKEFGVSFLVGVGSQRIGDLGGNSLLELSPQILLDRRFPQGGFAPGQSSGNRTEEPRVGK